MSILEIHWLHKRLNVRTSYESRVWTELKKLRDYIENGSSSEEIII